MQRNAVQFDDDPFCCLNNNLVSLQGVNEETEKKGVVDKEGDAVMVVWKVRLFSQLTKLIALPVQIKLLQEEINKNQKPPNNNRDSVLFGLDVPPKPEVPLLLRFQETFSVQVAEEPISPSPRIARDVWSTDHEGSQIRSAPQPCSRSPYPHFPCPQQFQCPWNHRAEEEALHGQQELLSPGKVGWDPVKKVSTKIKIL